MKKGRYPDDAVKLSHDTVTQLVFVGREVL